MSQDPWDDWSDAWQDAAPSPSVDLDEVERRLRRRLTWRAIQLGADLAACLVALAISIWSMTKGGPLALAMGSAGLAFALFGLSLLLGRNRAPSAMADRSVAAALDWEIAVVASDVRRSLGGLTIAAVALVFLGFCMAMFVTWGGLTPMRVWAALASLAMVVGSALSSSWLLVRRRTRLRRLTALREELTREGD